MRGVAILVLGAMWGCSSGAEGTKPSTETAGVNPCVTAGASYVVHFVEHPGGQCGPVPDEVINTEPNGTVSAPTGCTGESRPNGCIVSLTNYSCPANGGRITVNGQITWAQDGSSAKGTDQYVLQDPTGETCTSTYDVTYSRQ